ncbi:MAG TPA: chemotaxis protein CheW [Thermoanaerobaculia bacterium]|nr:chemotaxis protein CheW [Thermoanaerobaculia bacterium]
MDAPAATASAAFPSGRAGRIGIFRLGGRLFGVAGELCRQFVELDSVTLVPQAPAHLLGVIQLRGRIVPVVDLRRLLGLAPLAAGRPGAMFPQAGPAPPAGRPASLAVLPALIVEAERLEAALAIDEIVGFESFAGGGEMPDATAADVEAEPATPGILAALRRFGAGTVAGTHGAVALLEMGKVLRELRILRIRSPGVAEGAPQHSAAAAAAAPTEAAADAPAPR